LQQLLESNELGQFAQVFTDHEVDLRTFSKLREAHLIDMGFDRIGTRIRVMTLIEQLQGQLTSRSPSVTPAGQSPPPHASSPAAAAAAAVGEDRGVGVSPSPSHGENSIPRKMRPGEIPFEELEFLECVGRGSFGSVFR